MPACKQYGGITREEMEKLRQDLEKEGVNVPQGDDVAVTGPFNIKLQATYIEDNQTLKICITNKPFFIPESGIWKIVDTGVAPYTGP